MSAAGVAFGFKVIQPSKCLTPSDISKSLGSSCDSTSAIDLKLRRRRLQRKSWQPIKPVVQQTPTAEAINIKKLDDQAECQ